MIFLNLDEVFIDRVGHAAGVFGYELPKGVAFGLEQLRVSLRLSPIEFDNLIDSARSSWEQSNGQPWIWSLLGSFDAAVLDYRLVGEFLRDEDVRRYMDWTLKKLGHRGVHRLVLHSDQYPVPMRPGDTLVAASERKGKQW